MSVFVPGHITGFFTIENHEVSLKNGSLGVGFLLSKGVRTTITPADELTIDVNQADDTVINEVLSIFEVETKPGFNENMEWEQKWWGSVKLPEITDLRISGE